MNDYPISDGWIHNKGVVSGSSFVQFGYCFLLHCLAYCWAPLNGKYSSTYNFGGSKQALETSVDMVQTTSYVCRHRFIVIPSKITLVSLSVGNSFVSLSFHHWSHLNTRFRFYCNNNNSITYCQQWNLHCLHHPIIKKLTFSVTSQQSCHNPIIIIVVTKTGKSMSSIPHYSILTCANSPSFSLSIQNKCYDLLNT